jgi:hypothetical protein
VNGPYHNSTLYFDFYFPKLNEYVEVAGRLEKEDYSEHMELKKQTFGFIIIDPKNSISEFKNIVDRIKHYDK